MLNFLMDKRDFKGISCILLYIQIYTLQLTGLKGLKGKK